MPLKRKILVVDDEQSIRTLVQRQLNSDYEVFVAASGAEALEIVKKSPDICVVITDIKMPDMDGISLLAEIKQINKDISVIISTGYGSMDMAVDSMRAGAIDFISKPFTIETVKYTVKRAIDSYDSIIMIKVLNDGLQDAYRNLEEAKESLETKVMERTAELSLSEKKYRGVIENSFDPIIIFDDKMQIKNWNMGAELTFGYKESEVLGKGVDLLLVDEKTKGLEQLKEKGFIKNYVMKWKNRAGEPIYVNITASFLESGEIFAILRDITQEKRIDQMKTDFVSNVSHELRTPLTSIKGAVELVLSGAEGELTDSQKEMLKIVENNALRLIKLISDLLDLSKIEAGKTEMDIKPYNVAEIVKGTVKEMLPIGFKKKIEIVYKGPDFLPRIFCDKNMIKQVIVNLLGNAVKFTPENGVVTVRVEEENKDIKISVSDTGMGISKEDYAKLFERFQQIDSSSTRVYGGTGLGLAISKSIILAHKGRIWVESELGKGSVFSFVLPKAKDGDIPEEVPAVLPVLAPGEKQVFSINKILVVDDDEDLSKVIQNLLVREGYEVEVAYSGLDAIKKAGEFNPHLITLDMLMPNMDGYSVAALLKQNPKTKNIPIVIVSVVYEKEKGYKLGVADYITKPFEPAQLFECIRRIELQVNGEKLKKKVLIVDDDPDIIALLTVSIKENNFSVMNAYDGMQAVSIAKNEKPDMILLDLMLPGMDGFEVIKTLKNDPETKDIPIIVVTARTVEDRSRAIKLGAREYMIKPFSLRTLVEQLKDIFEMESKKD
ncbi:MAG TPA: hypothetical protein DEE98_04145 [Elusimicrobia bacterium]|nr:MAG: hypothetical protein A2278_07155 [Elusimicrobia bacterium RIFOXYA12_FULL_49_49]OGS05986.1 MAG: hypothetical protein A2204_02900 [Elusimicrobia bacterium RIFOXYA1_FULL_47_7]OGS10531.1 MAG: hypothetical protein A2386_05485 [Elusimicrobia bacterium RIFOXYB1_FULL_48_9]OGS16185.1 MAG: hypothetical protein A2251_01030 [Elusimicrobia bacterium RIFOXYA2_FULL_47_53]OGS26616.1 MAG: hypothetical protein A2339_04330 [Elusimicrobia bacterium RIFOXYB12_FULL_50_12]OGS31339.1 MAG: hypothetical protein